MIEATANNTSKIISRREFLYYLLGASAAALAAGTCGAANWFVMPYLPLPAQRGLYIFTPSQLPSVKEPPKPFSYINQNIVPNASANFWLSNADQGLVAFSQSCPYRGCLFKWNINGTAVYPFPHFVCPCCGSQFSAGGVYIDGPAPRNVDQFAIEVVTPNGNRYTPADGGPVDIHGATQIVVDTQKKIMGKPRPVPTATPSR
jgi:Rieske Fe-S protein